MVLYEVENLDVLTSKPYLARLNDPTPWTARMMPHYRGMHRGLCTVAGSFGAGQGGVAALVRFTAEPQRSGELRRWLLQDALPGLARLPGLGSAHLLQGARAAAMTIEQRIRGADAAIDLALVITGYDSHAVAAAVRSLDAAGPAGLRAQGAVHRPAPLVAGPAWAGKLDRDAGS
ncbi:MAG TPA: hypothetical protein PKC97_11870 [Burkholderiaceae bacterium]|nr:hypothetical protein [Burkholderiaceae bacterium]